MAKKKFTGFSGLPLPRRAVRVLKERGIFAYAQVSVEHQQLTDCYVLRGLESGGAVGDIGRYITFAGGEGQPLEYLHPVEAIAVNGLHSIVISHNIVRVDMLRKDRTYELLITRHSLESVENGRRPRLETEILFRGIHGRLELNLCRRDKANAGKVVPSFFSLAGEPVPIPKQFLAVARAATKGVNCIGCCHAHYLRKPRLAVGKDQADDESTDKSSARSAAEISG